MSDAPTSLPPDEAAEQADEREAQRQATAEPVAPEGAGRSVAGQDHQPGEQQSGEAPLP